nr:RE28911p [Drosophila melanogaster]
MTSMPPVAKIEGSAIRMSTLMGNPCHVCSATFHSSLRRCRIDLF